MSLKRYKKTIKLFLMDGDPSGRVSCQLSNWSGIAYKIPRIKIKDSSNIDYIEKPGVYLLFGKDENNKNKIYIGEAEPVYKRLTEHISQKDFWNETIIFVSQSFDLNKAKIKHIENILYEKAKSVNRYSIENSNIPTKSTIDKSDEAEMEEFIDNILLLTSSLGHKVFEDLVDKTVINQPKKNVFYIKAAKGDRECNAKGIATSTGFVVLKDSLIAKKTVPALGKTYEKIRNELIHSGIIIEKNGKYIFNDDYEFPSASTAARIVMGRSANGLNEWKLENGKTLKETEQ